MRSSTMAAISGAVVGGVLTAVTMRKSRAPGVSSQFGEVLHKRLGELKFVDQFPGVSKADLIGDPRRGAYVSVTQFKPGYVNARHKHPSDIHVFVISGAYIYRTDGREIRVGPNEYLFVPAGDVHVSGGDPSEGATFLEQSPGRFDLITVD